LFNHSSEVRLINFFQGSINLVLFQRYIFGSIRTFEPRSKRFNIRCVECIEVEIFSHYFVLLTFVCKFRDEFGVIFTSYLDSSHKHIEIDRIRGFDFRLTIVVKFD
jgi:hypothetical protein